MYYLRTKAAADAIKFTLDVEALLKTAGNIDKMVYFKIIIFNINFLISYFIFSFFYPFIPTLSLILPWPITSFFIILAFLFYPSF